MENYVEQHVPRCGVGWKGTLFMEQIGLPQAGMGGGGSRVYQVYPPSLHHLISVTDLLFLRSHLVEKQPSRQRAPWPSKRQRAAFPSKSKRFGEFGELFLSRGSVKRSGDSSILSVTRSGDWRDDLDRSESRFVTVCTSSDRTDGILIMVELDVRIEILTWIN
jgi:hypothetical protein